MPRPPTPTWRLAPARRAFDTTKWSSDWEFRGRCLLQLQQALEVERGILQGELIAEAQVSGEYLGQDRATVTAAGIQRETGGISMMPGTSLWRGAPMTRLFEAVRTSPLKRSRMF
jgi:hypothetical protein